MSKGHRRIGHHYDISEELPELRPWRIRDVNDVVILDREILRDEKRRWIAQIDFIHHWNLPIASLDRRIKTAHQRCVFKAEYENSACVRATVIQTARPSQRLRQRYPLCFKRFCLVVL